MSITNSPEEVPPTTRRKIQAVNCGVDHGWTAVYQTVAKRMFDYLNKSEVLKVNVRELEFHVLAPNERNRYRHRAHCDASSRLSVGREQMRLWSPVCREGEAHQRMPIMLEQKSQERCQAIEQISERQKLLATRLEKIRYVQKGAPDKFHEQMFLDKKDLEEQKFREESEMLEKRYRLERLKKERERASVLEEKELPLVEGAVTGTTSCSLTPSIEPDTNEENVDAFSSHWMGEKAGGMPTWKEEWRSLPWKVYWYGKWVSRIRTGRLTTGRLVRRKQRKKVKE